MSLSSAFGHKSSGYTFHNPHYSAPKYAAPKKQDHSLIHNLLHDVRTAAVGIPMGLISSGKALGLATTGNFGPLEHIGSSMFHSYGYMYGPAFHGHLGTTLHRMGQHPLQPLLDAISIATLPLAGAGAGIKAVDTIAFMGERIGMVSAERAAQTARAASFFRPRAVKVDVLLGRPAGFIMQSANPTIRGMHNLSMGTKVLLAKALPETFGDKGRVFDLTEDASLGRQQTRWLALERSKHGNAKASMAAREMSAFKDLFKNGNLNGSDIALALTPHIREVAETHAFKVSPSKMMPIKKMKAAGYELISKKDQFLLHPQDKSVAEMGRWIENFGQVITAKKLSQAKKDAEGNYLVMHRQTLKELQAEAARTHKAIRVLFDNPTKVWKWMVLATAPRYFVNNVVGNGLMYGMAANPIGTTRAMYQSVKQIAGKRAAIRGMSEIEQAQYKIMGDFVDKHFAAATEGFGNEVTRDLKRNAKIQNPALRKIAEKVEGGLFDLTHYYSDTIPRRALVNLFIRRTEKYQTEYRNLRRNGVSAKEAHKQAADTAAGHSDVNALVSHQVDDILGQYQHFSRTEKMVKRVVPFYSWDRAIMRHAWHLAAERPAAAAAIAQLGDQGSAQTLKILGDVPDFMLGVVPLEVLGISAGGPLGFLLGDSKHGRHSILATQGLNPYAAVPDVTDLLGTIVHGNPTNAKAGEALAGQLNPFLTGVIEHYSGQSLMSGRAKPPKTGLVQDIGRNVFESTPTVKLIETKLQGRPHAKVDAKGMVKSPLLYRGDTKQQVLSFLGAPVKDFAPSKAAELARREHGVTLHHPRAKKYKPVGLKHFTKKHSSHKRRAYKARKPSLRLRMPHPKAHNYLK